MSDIQSALNLMKFLILFAILASCLSPVSAQDRTSVNQGKGGTQDGGGVIVYSQGGAFMIGGPKGWITDTVVGRRLGTCCVYYPKGSTWDNAETVMYPSIVTKRSGQSTLREFMAHDLASFREHDPKMRWEDGKSITLRHGRAAKLRYFYGVNKSSSEAVAYIDEDKIIGVLIVSSKTGKGLANSMPLFREMLDTYLFMNVQNTGEKPAKQPLELPKD